MTDEQFKDAVVSKLESLTQELKGFNGTPGLCKRVSNLEVTVRRIVYGLCLVGGTGGIWTLITKLVSK